MGSAFLIASVCPVKGAWIANWSLTRALLQSSQRNTIWVDTHSSPPVYMVSHRPSKGFQSSTVSKPTNTVSVRSLFSYELPHYFQHHRGKRVLRDVWSLELDGCWVSSTPCPITVAASPEASPESHSYFEFLTVFPLCSLFMHKHTAYFMMYTHRCTSSTGTWDVAS